MVALETFLATIVFYAIAALAVVVVGARWKRVRLKGPLLVTYPIILAWMTLFATIPLFVQTFSTRVLFEFAWFFFGISLFRVPSVRRWMAHRIARVNKHDVASWDLRAFVDEKARSKP